MGISLGSAGEIKTKECYTAGELSLSMARGQNQHGLTVLDTSLAVRYGCHLAFNIDFQVTSVQMFLLLARMTVNHNFAVVFNCDAIWFSLVDALPFATWVMSHVLSDVVSCHCYDLRIIGHLQQPCQDPNKSSQTKKKKRHLIREVCRLQKKAKQIPSHLFSSESH